MRHVSELLDEKAKELASDYLQTEAELLEVLLEMRRRKVFARLNYKGIADYCEQALRLSRAQGRYFEMVAIKAIEVPAIQKAIESGEITLSQARRIVSVVTVENHQEWIE